MRIACPCCSERFELPEGVLSESGALSVCRSCGSQFRVLPNGLTLAAGPCMETCRKCRGTGKDPSYAKAWVVPIDGDDRCPACEGSGRVPKEQ